MDVTARVTSKGQVTIPKSVRSALGIGEGDDLIFRVVGAHAVVARTPKFLDLAGSVVLPPGKRGVPLSEVRRTVRRARGAR